MYHQGWQQGLWLEPANQLPSGLAARVMTRTCQPVTGSCWRTLERMWLNHLMRRVMIRVWRFLRLTSTFGWSIWLYLWTLFLVHFLCGVDVFLLLFLDSASLGLHPSAVSAYVHSNMDIDWLIDCISPGARVPKVSVQQTRLHSHAFHII